jgi:50S ribosomal subunit-associated GTPase HflX
MASETLAPHADGKRDACPTILVLAKCDLASHDGDAPPDAIRTSAVTGFGIDVLAAAIIRRLVPEEHDEPDLLLGAVPFTQRQVNGIA